LPLLLLLLLLLLLVLRTAGSLFWSTNLLPVLLLSLTPQDPQALPALPSTAL
jgi:hypothetical protein